MRFFIGAYTLIDPLVYLTTPFSFTFIEPENFNELFMIRGEYFPSMAPDVMKEERGRGYKSSVPSFAIKDRDILDAFAATGLDRMEGSINSSPSPFLSLSTSAVRTYSPSSPIA